MSQVTEPDLEVAWDDAGVQYRLTGRLGADGPELTGVEIRAAAQILVEHIRAPLITTFVNAFQMSEGEIHQRQVQRRGRPKDKSSARNRLDEVARIARSADYGERSRTVADWFGISVGYARQLISQAAAAGYSVWR